MKRLFIVRNAYVSILMSIYAKNTFKKEFQDIIYIPEMEYDQIISETVATIKNTQKIHPWFLIIDFNQHIKNKYIRKIVIKIKNYKTRFLNLIRINTHNKKIKKYIFENQNDIVEINISAKDYLYQEIIKLNPAIQVNFFECGIGDYEYFINKDLSKKFHLFSLFHKEYIDFLKKEQKNELKESFVDCVDLSNFRLMCESIVSAETKNKLYLKKNEKNIALLVIQNLESYYFDKNCWYDFFDKCLEKIPNPNEMHFMIKPHMGQYAQNFDYIKSYFNKKKLSYSILSDDKLMGTNIEILFHFIESQVKYVFSIFSSSIFHLSFLYDSSFIKYFYSYEFIISHMKKKEINPEIKKYYLKNESIIKDCFAKKCEELFN